MKTLKETKIEFPDIVWKASYTERNPMLIIEYRNDIPFAWVEPSLENIFDSEVYFSESDLPPKKMDVIEILFRDKNDNSSAEKIKNSIDKYLSRF